MNEIKKNEKLRRTRISFWLNLTICVITMFLAFKSLDSLDLWKSVASSVVFIGFFVLTILAFRRMNKLQKEVDKTIL